MGLDRRVLTLAIARMAEAVGNSFLIIVLPLFIASAHVGGSSFGIAEVTITGIVLALFGVVNSSLQPLTGRLSDRIGSRRWFILAGLGLLAVANASYALVDAYAQIIGLRILQGIADALIVPASIALVNDVATDADRGGNMGIYNAFRLVGFGIGPVGAGIVLAGGPYGIPVGGSITVLTGFDAAFLFAGATAAIAFALVFVSICDPASGATANEHGSTQQTDDGSRRSVITRPIIALGVVSFLAAVSIALFATLGDLVNARLDQGSQMFGLQFAAFVFAHIVFQAPIGRATDFVGRKSFIVAGALLLVPTTALQGFVMDPWHMFAVRFAQGTAAALVFSPAMALAGDLAPRNGSGETLSVVTMSFGLGIAVGPFLSGVLVTAGFAVPFVTGAAFAGIGAILVMAAVAEPA